MLQYIWRLKEVFSTIIWQVLCLGSDSNAIWASRFFLEVLDLSKIFVPSNFCDPVNTKRKSFSHFHVGVYSVFLKYTYGIGSCRSCFSERQHCIFPLWYPLVFIISLQRVNAYWMLEWPSHRWGSGEGNDTNSIITTTSGAGSTMCKTGRVHMFGRVL